jgi:hypothetical protein
VIYHCKLPYYALQYQKGHFESGDEQSESLLQATEQYFLNRTNVNILEILRNQLILYSFCFFEFRRYVNFSGSNKKRFHLLENSVIFISFRSYATRTLELSVHTEKEILP